MPAILFFPQKEIEQKIEDPHKFAITDYSDELYHGNIEAAYEEMIDYVIELVQKKEKVE